MKLSAGASAWWGFPLRCINDSSPATLHTPYIITASLPPPLPSTGIHAPSALPPPPSHITRRRPQSTHCGGGAANGRRYSCLSRDLFPEVGLREGPWKSFISYPGSGSEVWLWLQQSKGTQNFCDLKAWEPVALTTKLLMRYSLHSQPAVYHTRYAVATLYTEQHFNLH